MFYSLKPPFYTPTRKWDQKFYIHLRIYNRQSVRTNQARRIQKSRSAPHTRGKVEDQSSIWKLYQIIKLLHATRLKMIPEILGITPSCDMPQRH